MKDGRPDAWFSAADLQLTLRRCFWLNKLMEKQGGDRPIQASGKISPREGGRTDLRVPCVSLTFPLAPHPHMEQAIRVVRAGNPGRLWAQDCSSEAEGLSWAIPEPALH